jgi:hypothetical protein
VYPKLPTHFKLAGSENPNFFLRFFLREWSYLASWVMQKIGGILKPKYIFKILFEGGSGASDAENWRDLKTQIYF